MPAEQATKVTNAAPKKLIRIFLCLHEDLLGLLVQRELHVAHISAQGFGSAGFQILQLRGQPCQRLDFGLGFQCFNFHRAAGLHDLLVRAGLGQADVRGYLVVSRVDRGQRGLDFLWRINAGDQRGIEHHAVARRRGQALVVHVLVEVTQVLADVIDGDANDGGRIR